MELTGKQKNYLRGLAHSLKPVVQSGKGGLTENLFDQIRQQLAAHELIKVSFGSESAVQPAEAIDPIQSRTSSSVVQKLGRNLVVYRRHDTKPKIDLPKRSRNKERSQTNE